MRMTLAKDRTLAATFTVKDNDRKRSMIEKEEMNMRWIVSVKEATTFSFQDLSRASVGMSGGH